MTVDTAIAANRGGHIGLSSPRADGVAKVRGEARYAAEHPASGLLHGFPVASIVSHGRIAAFDTHAALQVPGVVTVLTHENVPPQGTLTKGDDLFANITGAQPALEGPQVHFYGQFVALVIAETYEAAREAASLVFVEMAATPPDPEPAEPYTPKSINAGAPPDTSSGDVEAALAAAAVTVDATYTTPVEHHNAMEPHAATTEWRDDRLQAQDGNQGVSMAALALASTMQLRPDQVRVESRYVGGGFGAKFGLHPHLTLAALGTTATGRPVKVVLTRQQVPADHGHRSATRQRMRLGAAADGRLSALSHETWVDTSMHDEFVEQAGAISRMMYAAPNRLTTHRVSRVRTPTPAWMRAPGEAPGSFALECAMDELAHALGMDPIALRIVNEPECDPEDGRPWSSRSLVACLEQGAARFGWDRRDPVPGRVRDRRWRVGMGVASATYPAFSLPASARMTLAPDGTAVARIAAADIGTGAYTVLRQVVAETLGLRLDQVEVQIGDSDLPMAFGAGGSTGTASFGSAVVGAAAGIRAQLADFARRDPHSPLRGVNSDDLVLAGGRIEARDDASRGEALVDLLGRNKPEGLDADYAFQPDQSGYSSHAFGAQFAEVAVDEDSGEVRVRRLLGAFGVGRVLNPRTVRSQFIGGMIMGLGQALMEETLLDARYGQWFNRDLGDYHVPVHADVPVMEAFTVDEDEPYANALGVKGVGEIGIVGVAAAITNAVFNATGTRVRSLPVMLEKARGSAPGPR